MENQTPRKPKLPAFLILGIIAVIAALVLALTNAVTKGPIEEHRMAALQAAFGAVMPAETYTEVAVPEGYDVSSLYEARNGDELVGYCVTAAGKGYNGDVAVTLGVDPQGIVTGCVVGDTNFAETAGFGARAREDWFQDQFKGIDAVNGGAFEAISGATITSTAVLSATNQALRCVSEVCLSATPAKDPLVVFGAPVGGSAPAEEHTATARGFQSDVTVTYSLDADGAIATLTIDSSGETDGYGTRCGEGEFAERFIGKTAPFTLGDNVDALSGATVTSTAVVDALNAALAAPDVKPLTEGANASLGVNADGAAVVAPNADYSGQLDVSLTVENGAVVGGEFIAPEGVYTGSAKGFQSDVKVTATLDDAGAIATLTIDSSKETPGYGTRCAEDEFVSRFIGKTAPFVLGENVDALSGATKTSGAVVNALNSALGHADAVVDAASSATDATSEATSAATPVATETPAAEVVSSATDATTGATAETPAVTEAPAAEVESSATDATSGATAATTAADVKSLVGVRWGYKSWVKVLVDVDADGVVKSLDVQVSGETDGLGTRCAEDAFEQQFIGKARPFTLGEGIDAVSHATVTSRAVVDAINAALEPAEAPAAPAVTEAPAADAESSATDATSGATAETPAATEAPAAEVETSATDATSGATVETPAATEAPAAEVESSATDATSGATAETPAVTETPAAEAVSSATDATSAATTAAAADVKSLVGVRWGYKSWVKVLVDVDADGVVKGLDVQVSGETDGLGTRCAEDAFEQQFIGKARPFTLGEGIDAVSRATVTSRAVVDAINAALEPIALPAE